MKKPVSLLMGAGMLAAAHCSAEPAGALAVPPARPNILILLCDQLSEKAFGAELAPWITKPNLDGIRRRGVIFENAFTACPLCLPARASLWTGRYPHETGAVANEIGAGHHADRYPGLGQIFREAGYLTAHFGKQHDAGTLRTFEIISEEPEVKEIPSGFLPVNKDSRMDAATTDLTVDFLEKRRNSADQRPYLLVADLNNPHNICQFVGENVNLTIPENAALPPLPGNFEIKDPASLPLPVRYICCTHPRLRQAAQWSAERYRFYLWAYCRYTEMVDRQIGTILQALERSGTADNTVVILLADHGEGLAEHRMVTKQQSFYEPIIHIPMVIANAPAGKTPVKPERLVSTLDLLPTLCDLAGIRAPEGLPGFSMLRQEEREYVSSEWVSEYFNTISPARMIRDARYKYVHYLEGGEELFDLASDPGEVRNLALETASLPLLERYRAKLQQHLERSGDPYRSLPVVVDPRYRSHAPGYPEHTGSDSITDGRKNPADQKRIPENNRLYLESADRARQGAASK